MYGNQVYMIPVSFQFAVNVGVTSYFSQRPLKDLLAEKEDEVKITVN